MKLLFKKYFSLTSQIILKNRFKNKFTQKVKTYKLSPQIRSQCSYVDSCSLSWQIFLTMSCRFVSMSAIETFWFENNHSKKRSIVAVLKVLIKADLSSRKSFLTALLPSVTLRHDKLQYILLLIYVILFRLSSCTCHSRPRSRINKTLSASFNPENIASRMARHGKT